MNADYWRALHASTPDDLAAVNYPSFPPAFNRLVDRIFARPILEAVSTLKPAVALEIGCGRGRWLRRLRSLGWRAHGLDIAPAGRPGALAEAPRLPVRAASVDLALAVTVLQHVDAQAESLSEMARVVRPGGSLLLVELIDRPGVAWQAHVRPQAPAWWRERIEEQGFRITREEPIEYLPLLRILEARTRRRSTAPTSEASVGVSVAARMGSPAGTESGAFPPTGARIGKVRYAAGTAMAWASALLEPLAPFLVPGGASHRLWLAQR